MRKQRGGGLVVLTPKPLLRLRKRMHDEKFKMDTRLPGHNLTLKQNSKKSGNVKNQKQIKQHLMQMVI